MTRPQRFLSAMLGAMTVVVALPELSFFASLGFLLNFSVNLLAVAITAGLVAYILAVAILVSWKSTTSSPLRMCLSGLSLPCITWVLLSLSFGVE